MKNLLIATLFTFILSYSYGQIENYNRDKNKIYLDSKEQHGGDFLWKMIKASDVTANAAQLSVSDFPTQSWMQAIVPGTVLNSLVYDKVYPEPYYGLNNKLGSNLIPDIARVGREAYTYWFRTEFSVPSEYKDKIVWLQIDGINYRAEIWLNGNLVSTVSGMFMQSCINVSDFAKIGEKNALAVKVYPVDMPGTNKVKPWRPRGENRNGGDGNIGLNTTMLMSVGWDFSFKDGIRTETPESGGVFPSIRPIRLPCVIHL